MSSQQGYRDWTEFKVDEQAWFCGSVIGTGDNLLSNIPQEIPQVGGGVISGSGKYHQSTLPSPKAPLGATVFPSFSWTFNPQLDETSARRLVRGHYIQGFGEVLLWHPWGTQDAWEIPTALRTKWSLPHLISGGPAVTATALRGIHVTPIVEVVAKRPAGKLITPLTFIASSPSSSQFSLTNTTEDQGSITTGDLTAQVGNVLSIWYWAILRVSISQLSQGLDRPGSWAQGLEFVLAPSPKDYELD